ncbi:MAG TPA: hypothetical protein VGM50_09810 [Gemmatimonadaceae bacterium]
MVALRKSGASFIAGCATLLFAAACGSSGSDVTGNGGGNTSPTSVVVASGDGQTGLVGAPLATPLTVKVTNTAGTAVQGATVMFAVTSGAASVNPASATTDTAGVAKTSVTLGSTAGNIVVTASVSGTSLTTTFHLVAGTSSQSTACATSSPQSVGVGGVVALSSGSGICLSGGAQGSEFALVVFHANPDSSQVASLTVRSSGGVTPVSTANVAPSFNQIPSISTQIERPRKADLQHAHDVFLRRMAQRLVSRSLVPRSQPALSRLVVPANPAIGTVFTVNANGGFDDADACDVPINIGARVAAVGTSNIILADTANPSPTFSSADYAAFATEFDTLINPLDIQNFGQPTDIDHNGKVLIVFTKEVNKLTPKNTTGGVVGGFTFERDLFPTADTTLSGFTFQACPTSNFAEMFYVLAPDPSGTVSVPHSNADVLSQTPGTLAHEYQHLINAGRRMYVNPFQGFFEDVWLNEGLSHIAEELLFYRRSGRAPRQNIGLSSFTSQAQVDIFGDEQGQNTGRYQVFLGKPDATSVYAGNDSLETRGATWNLLRYLADHRGTGGDADSWSLLVNTESHGQANLAHVFGGDYLTQIRNWATSVFADDIPGVTDTRYLQPSWNYRSIFPALCQNDACTITLNKYPLKVLPLSDATPASFTVFAGGAEYVRFFVPAGATGSIDWTSGGLPVSGLVQFTVVRSK